MPAIHDATNCKISQNETSVFIFIGGYVAHSVSKRLKFFMCSNYLSTNDDLEICSSSSSIYLFIINRGGLKKLSNFTYTICAVSYQIFTSFLNNYEEQFVNRVQEHRNILMELILRTLDFDCEICPKCEIPTLAIVNMCYRTIINILLNNYSKIISNNILTEKNRKKDMKLATLRK